MIEKGYWLGYTHRRFLGLYQCLGVLLLCSLSGVDVWAAPTSANGEAASASEKVWRLPVQPAKGSTVPLVYMSNLNGELEPCGCTIETDYGGILRRGQVVRQLRDTFKAAQQEVLLLSAGGLLDDYGASEAIKNSAILSGMQLIQYDAIGIQARDLLYGVDFIAGKSLPLINSTDLPAASLPDSYKDASGEIFQPFADHITVSRENTDFAIFSIMPPEALFPMKGVQKVSGDKKPALSKAVSKAFSKVLEKITAKMAEKVENDNVVVLMSSIPAADLKAYIDFHLVDVLITPSRNEHFVPPQWLGHTLWLQPGHRGMRMGVAQLNLTGLSRKPAKADPHAGLNLRVKSYSAKTERQIGLVSHEVVALDNQVPNDPALAAWYDAYNAAVVKDYEERSALQKKYSEGAAKQYHGVQVCAGCHKAVFEHWQTTDHSKAIQTLEDKNKAFDPACLKCHTVAFHEPGGFIDMEVTEHLANVQCENCHVDTPKHVADPQAHKPRLAQNTAEQVCTQCHNKDHSPSFDFEDYWPRIGHDLGGALQP